MSDEKDLEQIQYELERARQHLEAANQIAVDGEWSADETYVVGVLEQFVGAINDSIQRRFVEGPYEYEPTGEVEYLLGYEKLEE
ncbi:hypothetical protein KU306_12210 [Haloferax larsenii]|uniref:Uncharacterized protein n=1 Tax=Haloferax larsenii TaxID=302484 RepID=A0ABY5RF67_HALLR|nr:hypothetical protein [Haloferax larsenii]UVE49668.1 hypothetical protein KU306_12210 [Haloferax larsenii]